MDYGADRGGGMQAERVRGAVRAGAETYTAALSVPAAHAAARADCFRA